MKMSNKNLLLTFHSSSTSLILWSFTRLRRRRVFIREEIKERALSIRQVMKKTKEWAAEMVRGRQAGAKAKKKEVSYIG